MARNTTLQKAAEDKARSASVLGLIYGMCYEKHSAVFRNEFLLLVEDEFGVVNKANMRKFLSKEFGETPATVKSKSATEPREPWEIASLLLKSTWLTDGAAGLRKYQPRRYRGWLKHLIDQKCTCDDMSTVSQSLLAASAYHAGLDLPIIGIDE